MEILLAISIIIAIIIVWKKEQDKKNRANDANSYQYPANFMSHTPTVAVPQMQNATMAEEKQVLYERKNLLTKNEWYFYKKLKPIADTLGFTVLAKVRVADLVTPKTGLNKSEWQTAFNKINKKHIDFMLCNPENLYPLLLIELDDNSHAQEKQIERDQFIETLYHKTGYKLLRVKGEANLEEKIREKLQEKSGS